MDDTQRQLFRQAQKMVSDAGVLINRARPGLRDSDAQQVFAAMQQNAAVSTRLRELAET